MALEVGQLAPIFELLNQRGELVSLHHYLGKQNVVIYFYPRAMTPGCTVQACGIRDISKELEKHNAVVFAISPDTVEKLAKFEVKEKLNFNLLSDSEHKVAELYGVWGTKKFMGKVTQGIIRTTFVIGTDGKVAHVMDKVATKTHHQDLLQIL